MTNKITRSKEGLKLCDAVIEQKQAIEVRFLWIAKNLVKINDEKLWQGRWEDFEHFCRDGLKMDDTTAYKLMQIYQTFCVANKVEPIRLAQAGGWSRLSMIVPLVTDEKSADEWIEQAIHAQSNRDLKQLIRERNTGVNPMQCKHKNTARFIITKCKDCGESMQEFEHGK